MAASPASVRVPGSTRRQRRRSPCAQCGVGQPTRRYRSGRATHSSTEGKPAVARRARAPWRRCTAERGACFHLHMVERRHTVIECGNACSSIVVRVGDDNDNGWGTGLSESVGVRGERHAHMAIRTHQSSRMPTITSYHAPHASLIRSCSDYKCAHLRKARLPPLPAHGHAT